jgi:hypothetical protein
MIGWFAFCQTIVAGGKMGHESLSTILSEKCGQNGTRLGSMYW